MNVWKLTCRHCTTDVSCIVRGRCRKEKEEMNTTHCRFCGEPAHKAVLACPRIKSVEFCDERPDYVLNVELRDPTPHHESWSELDEATRKRKIAAGALTLKRKYAVVDKPEVVAECVLHTAYDTP